MADSLANHFLIAMPSLQDPNFSRTVTYICEHTDDGAMGIVINRPSDLTLSEILDHMSLGCEDNEYGSTAIYHGGPVQPDRGFVLHSPFQDWESTMKITDNVGITTSRDILAAIAAGEGPSSSLIALGYAGWTAGQLEQEMASNTWLSGPGNLDIVYNTDFDKRWEAAAALLGVDLNLISGDTGHA
jgi:putative transcriptional regulator